MSSNEVLVLRGTLEGHNGWVTSLATSAGQPNLLLSGSRDKTLISWKLTGDDQKFGVPVRSFKGHSHIVQDCTLTQDGAYALSASWDKTLRLWDVATGETYQRFVGHKSDVMSVAIDRKASMIISGSRDKTIKVWTIKGQCLATLLGHNDWVSQVRIAPTDQNDDAVTVISAGNDKMVKVCYFISNDLFYHFHSTIDLYSNIFFIFFLNFIKWWTIIFATSDEAINLEWDILIITKISDILRFKKWNIVHDIDTTVEWFEIPLLPRIYFTNNYTNYVCLLL